MPQAELEKAHGLKVTVMDGSTPLALASMARRPLEPLSHLLAPRVRECVCLYAHRFWLRTIIPNSPLSRFPHHRTAPHRIPRTVAQEVGFVSFLIKPLYAALGKAVPELAFYAERVEASIAMWTAMRAEALAAQQSSQHAQGQQARA